MNTATGSSWLCGRQRCTQCRRVWAIRRSGHRVHQQMKVSGKLTFLAAPEGAACLNLGSSGQQLVYTSRIVTRPPRVRRHELRLRVAANRIVTLGAVIFFVKHPRLSARLLRAVILPRRQNVSISPQHATWRWESAVKGSSVIPDAIYRQLRHPREAGGLAIAAASEQVAQPETRPLREQKMQCCGQDRPNPKLTTRAAVLPSCFLSSAAPSSCLCAWSQESKTSTNPRNRGESWGGPVCRGDPSIGVGERLWVRT